MVFVRIGAEVQPFENVQSEGAKTSKVVQMQSLAVHIHSRKCILDLFTLGIMDQDLYLIS